VLFTLLYYNIDLFYMLLTYILFLRTYLKQHYFDQIKFSSRIRDRHAKREALINNGSFAKSIIYFTMHTRINPPLPDARNASNSYECKSIFRVRRKTLWTPFHFEFHNVGTTVGIFFFMRYLISRYRCSKS